MKKLKKSGFILLSVLFTAILWGCGGENDGTEKKENSYELGRFEGLGAETELKILQDCFNQFVENNLKYSGKTIDDLSVCIYGGTYNGCVIVLIGSPELGSSLLGIMRDYYVAGIHFLGYITVAPIVWKDGIFYHLEDAYDAGLLTQDNIINIAELINPPEWI